MFRQAVKQLVNPARAFSSSTLAARMANRLPVIPGAMMNEQEEQVAPATQEQNEQNMDDLKHTAESLEPPERHKVLRGNEVGINSNIVAIKLTPGFLDNIKGAKPLFQTQIHNTWIVLSNLTVAKATDNTKKTIEYFASMPGASILTHRPTEVMFKGTTKNGDQINGTARDDAAALLDQAAKERIQGQIVDVFDQKSTDSYNPQQEAQAMVFLGDGNNFGDAYDPCASNS